MANKLSLIVLGGSGKTVKQIHCSHFRFYGFLILFILCLAALGYGVYDYLRLHRIVAAKSAVEIQLEHQNQEVRHQREQIQKFASEINELKDRILKLNDFENQIRVIANIDHSEEQEGLFGIGGSTPDDLNPDVELTQSHTRLIKEMHKQIRALEHASTKKNDTISNLLGTMEEQKNMLAHTPAIRPAQGWISSQFGYRKSPFTDKREFHKGIDIANRKGTPIVAAADGVISHIGKKGSLGNIVVIDHGYGLVTRYAHIDKSSKKVGDVVKRGETIALMGNSGRSTGPHLHYEVRLNGVPVNPFKYILN